MFKLFINDNLLPMEPCSFKEFDLMSSVGIFTQTISGSKLTKDLLLYSILPFLDIKSIDRFKRVLANVDLTAPKPPLPDQLNVITSSSTIKQPIKHKKDKVVYNSFQQLKREKQRDRRSYKKSLKMDKRKDRDLKYSMNLNPYKMEAIEKDEYNEREI